MVIRLHLANAVMAWALDAVSSGCERGFGRDALDDDHDVLISKDCTRAGSSGMVCRTHGPCQCGKIS